MPKVLDLPENTGCGYLDNASGIQISWTKTAGRLDIFGWYDSYVGINGGSFLLRQFFDKLGITKKDCDKAFKETK